MSNHVKWGIAAVVASVVSVVGLGVAAFQFSGGFSGETLSRVSGGLIIAVCLWEGFRGVAGRKSR